MTAAYAYADAGPIWPFVAVICMTIVWGLVRIFTDPQRRGR